MVFVLDRYLRPLMPCTERRARILLQRNRAKVKRVMPFTIILLDRTAENCFFQPLEIKLDPGSKTTGIAICSNKKGIISIKALYELIHRGLAIKLNLAKRAVFRKARRARKTRYRKPRFDNRTSSARKNGWLPPSIKHRVETIITWVKRFMRLLPMPSIVLELVKFDMHKMLNPDIAGKGYQQGELYSYEVMQYLLEKYNHTCVYCGINHDKAKATQAGNSAIYFEKEHVVPKSLGGSDSIHNLVLACKACNTAKSNLPLKVFLANKPDIYNKVIKQLKAPLHDAAAVNSSRNALYKALLAITSRVSTGSGALTKYNRNWLNIPKTHSLDAACVGDIAGIKLNKLGYPAIPSYVTIISCQGRGRYQRAISDKYGFPKAHRPRSKLIYGFQTGDIARIYNRLTGSVIANQARIAVKSSGCFSYKHNNSYGETSYKNCKKLQTNDGYNYSYEVRGITMLPNNKPDIHVMPKIPNKHFKRDRIAV